MHFAISHVGLAFLLLSTCAPAQMTSGTKDLGGGFRDHGVAAALSNHRGTVATVDGQGRNVVLVWLMDHRGGYSLLLIDAQTGKAEQFPVPFKPAGDIFESPYSSILSSANKYYSHFNGHFVEFDPVKRAFTFCSDKPAPHFSMGMTEDDKGVIWSVNYPGDQVISFNPKTREFHDYGEVYKQNWFQYPLFVASDDAGWVYIGIGHTASQILAFDPKSGKATPLLSEGERQKGAAYVYRDEDGKVYGQALREADREWYELYKGVARKIGKHDSQNPKPIITGNQTLFHKQFPDESKIGSCNLIEKTITIQDAHTSAVRELKFDYDSDGADVMGVATAPNGTICGGTTFPMRFFSYNPANDTWVRHPSYGQWNAIARFGDLFYAAAYPGGYLLEWTPTKPWVDTNPDKPASNPAYLLKADPDIHRPHRVFGLKDNDTVVMSGTPEYGYTGGGLLFWKRSDRSHVLLKDTQVIPNQSTLSMVELPGGKLLGGTTIEPGTGGEKKATQAELYIMDTKSKRVDWHSVVLPGVEEYQNLCVGASGTVYGIAGKTLFFVFNPKDRTIVRKQELPKAWGEVASQQGPRAFVSTPDGAIYLLCNKAIARVEPGSYDLKLVATPPESAPIEIGGDYLDGRIYYASSSHLCSYQLPQADKKN